MKPMKPMKPMTEKRLDALVGMISRQAEDLGKLIELKRKLATDKDLQARVESMEAIIKWREAEMDRLRSLIK